MHGPLNVKFFLACSSGLDRLQWKYKLNKLNWDENYKTYLSILSLSIHHRTNQTTLYVCHLERKGSTVTQINGHVIHD